MSISITTANWRTGLDTTTVRQFKRAVAIALVILAVGGLLYLVEKFLIRPASPFMENPGSVMMRAGGLTHFWVGWLFLFTSARIRNRRALRRLGILTLLGIGVCLLTAWFGGMRNPYMYIFFFSYFLIHEVRDEKTLCRAYGDVPEAAHGENQFPGALNLLAAVIMGGLVFSGCVLFNVTIKKNEILLNTPLPIYLLFLAIFIVLVFYFVRQIVKVGRQQFGSARAALAMHSSLLTVYLGIIFILLLGVVLAGVSLNMMILIHGGAWIAYVCYRLHSQPKPAHRNLWTWLRATPAGFVVLHTVVFAFVLLLMGMRVYIWHRVGIVSELVSREIFPYWAIMHISLSWWHGR